MQFKTWVTIRGAPLRENLKPEPRTHTRTHCFFSALTAVPFLLPATTVVRIPFEMHIHTHTYVFAQKEFSEGSVSGVVGRRRSCFMRFLFLLPPPPLVWLMMTTKLEAQCCAKRRRKISRFNGFFSFTSYPIVTRAREKTISQHYTYPLVRTAQHTSTWPCPVNDCNASTSNASKYERTNGQVWSRRCVSVFGTCGRTRDEFWKYLSFCTIN